MTNQPKPSNSVNWIPHNDGGNRIAGPNGMSIDPRARTVTTLGRGFERDTLRVTIAPRGK
jgi:hypothetical protein